MWTQQQKLFPECTADGQVAVPTNSFQATVMCDRAAMLKDLTKRWILELEADLFDLFYNYNSRPSIQGLQIPAIKETSI